MAGINISKAVFVKSAATARGFILDSKPKIVFAGKSNVGKSSVLNRLLGRKALAKVGNTPGKTIHVNYFDIDGKAFFVDLPGYGYAAVAKSVKERWGRLMESFFENPSEITLGVHIVDSRHAPTADDIGMSNWFKSTGRPFVVVANKIDKLKKCEIEGNLSLIRERLDLDDSILLIPFSAEIGRAHV